MGKVANQTKPIASNFFLLKQYGESRGYLEMGTIARILTETWKTIRTRGSSLSGQPGFSFLPSAHLFPSLSADWLILVKEFLSPLGFMLNITAAAKAHPGLLGANCISQHPQLLFLRLTIPPVSQFQIPEKEESDWPRSSFQSRPHRLKVTGQHGDGSPLHQVLTLIHTTTLYVLPK